VFADTKVNGSQEVLENWAKIKTEVEGRARKNSVLDEVSRALPALERAWKMQKKAAKIGFDWPSAEGIWAKIDEELNEVKEARTAADEAALEGECGDVLFSVVNLCRFFGINPSLALQRTNNKFEKRFKFVEKEVKTLPPPAAGNHPLETLDALWEAAKAAEALLG
jgi:tetrapyrrole methylase family protein/MazG family protein